MHYEWNTFASNWNHGGISCDVHFAGHLRSNRTNVWSDKSNIRNVQSSGARGLELRTAGLRELKKQHYRQQQYILACMVHCGNVLSMIIMWSLSSALTSEGADWDALLLTDSHVNIFMHKSWFINNSLTLTTNSKSMEKYSMFEQIVINIYMKFLKWH